MTLVIARGGGPRRSPDRLRNSAPWLRAQILGLATELAMGRGAYATPDTEVMRRKLLAIVEGQEPVR